MYHSERRYNPTELEKIEAAERARREEEMLRAEERIEARKKRKKRSFLSAGIGVAVGILYILWITFGPEIKPGGGTSLYEAYISLAGDSMAKCALLDFAPPVILAAALTLSVSAKERGRVYFVLTGVFALFVVIMVFMLYMSLMAG